MKVCKIHSWHRLSDEEILCMACGKSLNLASPERPRAAQHRAPRLPKALPAGVLEPDDLTPAQIERKFAQAKARLRYQRAVTQ